MNILSRLITSIIPTWKFELKRHSDWKTLGPISVTHLQNPNSCILYCCVMRNMQLAAITVISHDVQTTLQSVSEECQTICCNCLFLWFQNGWSWSPRKDSMLVNVTWNYAHSSGAWCDFIRFSRNSFWQAMATFPLLNTQCYLLWGQ